MQKQTKVTVRYPERLEELQAVYANHVQVMATSEDVTLDICQLQPQTAKEDTGAISAVDATPLVRVIMSHAHIARLIPVLQNALRATQTAPKG